MLTFDQMSFEAVPGGMIDRARFDDEAIRDQLRYVPELDFMVLPGEGRRRFHLVGYHADEEQRSEITAAITLDERPQACRKLNSNAKGVGLMIGNSDEAIDNMYEEVGRRARHQGVYLTPAYRPSDVGDFHHRHANALPIMAWGIAKHAGYIGLSKVTSTEKAVSQIERRYGEANIAIIDPAPTWLLDQRRRGVEYPVNPVWALYRDRQHRPLRRIGSVVPASR